MTTTERSELERILELVKSEKISREEAVRLLRALAPNVAKMRAELLENLVTLYLEDRLSSADLREMLSGGGKGFGFRIDADGLEFGLGDLGRTIKGVRIGETIRDAFRSAGMEGRVKGKTARMVRIEIEDAHGAEVRVNLPLGLANFAIKLIPKEAQSAMREQGIDVDALAALLQQDDLPEGNLLELEGADGTEIRVLVE